MSHSCNQCEFIIDLHWQGQITYMWSRNLTGELKHYKLLYRPKIYITAEDFDLEQYHQPSDRSLSEIKELLKSIDGVISYKEIECYPHSGHEKTEIALEVELASNRAMNDVIPFLKEQRIYLYNIDINRRQQFFLDLKGTALAKCHIKLKNKRRLQQAYEDDKDRKWVREYIIPPDCDEIESVQIMENLHEIDYEVPPYPILTVEVFCRQTSELPNYDDTIQMINVYKSHYLRNNKEELMITGTEKQILLQFSKLLRSFDPDFIQIERSMLAQPSKNGPTRDSDQSMGYSGGDKFMLNYLAFRAKQNGISKEFSLNRGIGPTVYQKQKPRGQAYFTYGQIIYRDPVRYIPGRVHLDYDNSFMLHEGGLAGLIELSRLGGMVPERASRTSIGTVLTAVEFNVNQSTSPKTLVPPTKADGEQFKPALGLTVADNGGLTYPASPGVYDHVWAIDFTSLYPFLMLKHNIGNETVLCPHKECQDPKTGTFVPEIGYHICQKRVCVVAKTMGVILKKRVMYKLIKKYPFPKEYLSRIGEVDSSLKWILVCCFGYLGFKNSRWGSIEAHQCVTAYARRYLLDAMKICEEHGYETVGGIVDSLFIRKRDRLSDNRENLNNLIGALSAHAGIPMDTEGKFQWVVFGKVRDFMAGALNRYFGYFEHDEFKLRGIKTRTRWCSQMEWEFQHEILNLLKHAKSVSEFIQLIPNCYERLAVWKQRLKDKDIDTRDLAKKIKSGKGAGNYKSNTIQALTTRKYQELGREVKAGQSFVYVVRDDRSRDTSRVWVGEEVKWNSSYDVNYYCTVLDKALEEIVESPQFQFFGDIVYSDEPMDLKLDQFIEEEEAHPSFSIENRLKMNRKKGRQVSLENYF